MVHRLDGRVPRRLPGKVSTTFNFTFRKQLNNYPRPAAIRAMGVRGRCLWESMDNEGDAIIEYITQVRAGHVIQYTTRAL